MKDLLAALVFFTRIPLGRFGQIEQIHFSRILPFWPLVGWLTSGITVFVYFLIACWFPNDTALIFALVTRLFLTGALHEDGLADFFDGFGGGRTKDRILAIMKDSHIGTYGVLALIIYYLLMYTTLSSLPFFVLLIGEPFAKGLTGLMPQKLPYARTAEQSKSGVIYHKMSFSQLLLMGCFALFPLLFYLFIKFDWAFILAACVSIVTFGGLIYFIRKKIGGYTGDCCGAFALLCELSFYLTLLCFST